MTTNNSVFVCSDLSGREPHKQVGAGIVVRSRNIGGVMPSTLARNAIYVGSIPALGTIFPLSAHPPK